MIDILTIFGFMAGIALGLIMVHELGHYLAGLLGGIPADAMRIRLLRFPQHVVLRQGEQWISPVEDIQKYVDLVWAYLKSTPRVYLFVSGGLVMETLFTVSLSSILLLTDWPKVALALTGLSLVLFLPWLLIDTLSIVRGRIVGDISGLWFLAPLPSVILVVILLAVRLVIIWLALSA